MVGDGDVGSNLVELRGDVGGQRVVLCVAGAGAQSGVQLGEGDGGGLGAQSAAQVLPGFGAGHAQHHASHVGVGVDLLGAGVDAAGAQVHCAHGNQTGLLLDLSEDLIADLGVVQGVGHVVIVGPEVAGVDHGHPLQASLGGQGGEADVGDVHAAHHGAGLQVVQLALGGGAGAVGVDIAGHGAAGQSLNGLLEGVHCGGVGVAGDGDGGEVEGEGRIAGCVILGRLGIGGLLGNADGDDGQQHHCSHQDGKKLFHVWFLLTYLSLITLRLL